MLRIAKVLVALISLFNFCNYSYAQSSCEEVTTASLQRLAPLLEKNDFSQIESIITTLESVCGKSEFTSRLQLMRQLILKEDTQQELAAYLEKHYDEILARRYDNAAEKNYATIYAKDKESFHFIPLNHPVDSLIRLKATALLNSPSYTLSEQEEAISLLFADDIDAFYIQLNRQPKQKPALQSHQELELNKNGIGFALYAGAFGTLGKNSTFSTSPSFGVSLMSPLANPFVFELALKFRLNTNDNYFEFNDNGVIKDVNSSSSFFFGGTAGYKVMDNGPWIILPKVGAGLGFINTGLSETTFYDGDYYDEGNGSSGIQYNNANTFHTFIGVALMRHVKGRKFIGLEAGYHYIPYNWDKDLITHIQPRYWSLELFLKL
ncbi:hypothetical protein [Sphingobacterium pedocola]|uniref:Outer membrane protein beta-barrel domain-containing protein n=1 Tax=Sphingobacterium pedocola TaxID=2082722 RepID=A0ABR9T3S6_9SPHI|nr:hypothetical protein [Sphingobacterium pedocola]MBE8720003.1 hypothetical protein [Sphingobacterium pedocola]